MDIETCRLIETHCHISSLINQFDFNVDDVLSLIKAERLTYALLIDPDNESLVARVALDKEIAGVLLLTDPRIDGFLKSIADLTVKNPAVVKGLKLFPNRATWPVSYALLEHVFAFANDHDLVIVTHTESGGAEAGRYKELLQKFPQTRLILYHAFPPEEAFALVNDFDYVYIDTSASAWGHRFQSRAIKEIGKKKIVFGIDSPLGFPLANGVPLPHFRDAAREVAGFFDNDDDIVEHVFWKNANRLFKLGLE